MSFNSQKENVLLKTYIGFILVGWNFRSSRTLAAKIWGDPGFLSGLTVFPPTWYWWWRFLIQNFPFTASYVSPQNSGLASASTAEASSRTKLQALNRFTAYKKTNIHTSRSCFPPSDWNNATVIGLPAPVCFQRLKAARSHLRPTTSTITWC